MIEIILRNDISDYEPKPLFGFTYRQVATAAVVVLAGAGLGFWLTQIGVPQTPMIVAVMAAGSGIGYVGLGRPHGLKAEVWLRICREDAAWPRCVLWSSPKLSPASERMPDKGLRPDWSERRAAARERSLARFECEADI